MPMAASDPRLLREQETPPVIGKNRLLDQEMPAVGFVGIQDSSLVWEEQEDQTKIITTEGLTTCLDSKRGWTITSRGWSFLKNQECWEGHETALIITIQKETIRTEELEETTYRSAMWAVLRALQQINSATKIEREAATSAPHFFQSARRADLSFRGGGEGPTAVMWESLPEQDKASWLDEASTTHEWFVWCKSKKGAEEIRSFELSGKKPSLTMMKRNQKRRKKNRSKKNAHRRAYDAGHDGSKATSKVESPASFLITSEDQKRR